MAKSFIKKFKTNKKIDIILNLINKYSILINIISVQCVLKQNLFHHHHQA